VLRETPHITTQKFLPAGRLARLTAVQQVPSKLLGAGLFLFRLPFAGIRKRAAPPSTFPRLAGRLLFGVLQDRGSRSITTPRYLCSANPCILLKYRQEPTHAWLAFV
jgi:hypothetical protein